MTEIHLLTQAVGRRWLFSSHCVLRSLGVRLGFGTSPGPLDDFLLMLLFCGAARPTNKIKQNTRLFCKPVHWCGNLPLPCATTEAGQQVGLDLGKKSVAVHMHNRNRGLLEIGALIGVVKRKLWVAHRKWGAVGSACGVRRARQWHPDNYSLALALSKMEKLTV